MRYLFFVLVFFLLLSIVAGLFMPGKEFGRYAVALNVGQSCEALERELLPFNVNQVSFGVREADADDFDGAPVSVPVCWLEIAGVSEAGMSAEAAPVHAAALERVTAVLQEDRFYLPRYGQAETRLVWLLSLLLAALALGARLRKQKRAAAES
ncbi:MAG: hypothetical protein ACXIUM_13285 [Wenzhouxiangella sp.]